MILFIDKYLKEKKNSINIKRQLNSYLKVPIEVDKPLIVIKIIVFTVTCVHFYLSTKYIN